MRPVWIVLAIAVGGACGDNVEPPRLEVVAAMPTDLGGDAQDVAFDRDDVPTVRLKSGGVLRFVEDRWRPIPMLEVKDFGTDNDGTLLVLSAHATLHQLDNGAVKDLGRAIGPAVTVGMPMQVPSGNRYVTETRRSYVLTVGATAWVESPPMFFARPVRAYDRTLYAATSAGVQRFEGDGTRPFVVTCEQLGTSRCTDLVLGGADGGRVVVGDKGRPEVIVVDGGAVERVVLPGGFVPVRIAAGKGATIVLARQPATTPANEVYALFAVEEEAVRVETRDDPPTSATRLIVDGDGTVWVATQSLANVVR